MNMNTAPVRQDRFDRNERVEALKTDGKTSNLLDMWLRGAEVKDASESLRVNIEWAESYRDAGLLEEALEAFEDASYEASQLGETELYEYCMAEIEKLRSS